MGSLGVVTLGMQMPALELTSTASFARVVVMGFGGLTVHGIMALLASGLGRHERPRGKGRARRGGGREPARGSGEQRRARAEQRRRRVDVNFSMANAKLACRAYESS